MCVRLWWGQIFEHIIQNKQFIITTPCSPPLPWVCVPMYIERSPCAFRAVIVTTRGSGVARPFSYSCFLSQRSSIACLDFDPLAFFFGFESSERVCAKSKKWNLSIFLAKSIQRKHAEIRVITNKTENRRIDDYWRLPASNKVNLKLWMDLIGFETAKLRVLALIYTSKTPYFNAMITPN